jgi:Cu/Ag efflux protein CusF
MRRRTIPLLSTFWLAILMPFAAAVGAEEADMPGKVAMGSAATIATVESIDQETREVTLRDPDGSLSTFVAGDEVRNLAQVKKGDVVLMEYFAGLAVALKPNGSGIREHRKEVAATRAKPGEKPAGTVTKTVDVVATVEALDPEARTVTLKGAKQTLTFKVSDDIDLNKVNIGDDVVATYVESFAVSVEPAPKVSGEVELQSKAVAVGIGYEWGSGTLTLYDGSTHPFKVTGLSVVDVGYASVEASGQVYHLSNPKHFAGTYLAGAAGAALVKGGSAATMKNDKGVVMQLKSKQEGVRLTLAPAGLTIKLEE